MMELCLEMSDFLMGSGTLWGASPKGTVSSTSSDEFDDELLSELLDWEPKTDIINGDCMVPQDILAKQRQAFLGCCTPGMPVASRQISDYGAPTDAGYPMDTQLMIWTHERQTVRMTQAPQETPCTKRAGATQESAPHLPMDALPRSSVQQELVDIVEELFDEASSTRSSPATDAKKCIDAETRQSSPEDPRLIEQVNELQGIIRQLFPGTGHSHKVPVHQVVLALLVADHRHLGGLAGVLSFCTENGVETGRVGCNFTARDTKTMGLIWQKLKGNSRSDYDTFARAMRLDRERRTDFFGYLDAGKGAKKRIYKLGSKGWSELQRIDRIVLQGQD